MPRRTDIKSILIIGAGPIVIGQACEFDYSGTQACKALKEEGFRVILVNSNPATIMTDPELADATYIEPITPEVVAKIIAKERPDALLPTMGGQTALNTALSLRRMGVLDRYNVEMIGADATAIDKAEDRALFREAMKKIGLETPKSMLANATDVKNADRKTHEAERAAVKAEAPDRSRRRARRAGNALEPRRRRPQAALHQPRHGDRRPGARPCRPARHHPPVLHHGRHRRRHRLQPRRILRDRPVRPRRLADHRSADRGKRARLEGIRDGGCPRQGRQLHHRLLDREHRPDGRAYGRLDHRRPGADADRQGIPDDAQRLDRGAARDRRRDRRLQRAVRRQPGRRPPGGHRDEPARLALLRPGLQGDRLPDRQDRGQARRRLHAGRAGERHHRRRDARFLRAVDRLCRHKNPALCLREIPRRRAGADHRR